MTSEFWKKVSPLVAIAILVLGSDALLAQNIVTGGVTGTVTDPTGAVVANAKVALRNNATQETRTTTTNSSGVYAFPLLKPGAYTINVTQTGFRTVTQPMDVLVGQNLLVNFQLAVGNTSETVEVTGQGVLLQTEDANVSSNFDTRTVESIPNPGGDITWVAQIAPGVTMNNSTGGGFGNFSAFGLPGTANLFTINGNDYNDPFLNLNNSGSSNLLLGGNEVQEVAVVSNGYTGQYGRQAGAQVDYATKSGSNSYHGDALYYWTGRALSANNWFNNNNNVPRPFENNNQWAASFGGPIKKDKAFFFVNTEGIRYIFGTASTINVPTPAFETFVLSQVPATAQAFYQNVFTLYNGAPGINRAAPQANSCASVVGFPDPLQQCLEQFGTAGANGNKEWLLSGRVDYTFSEKDRIFGRVKFDRGKQPTYTDPINPKFNNQSIQPQNEGQLNYTHLFSPTVVNNFIFSNLWYSAVFKSAAQSSALALFPGNLVSSDSALTALGTGSGNPGGFAAGFLYPQGRNVEQWQVVDDLSLTRGNHGFKMGVNFRRDDVTDYTAGELPYPAMVVSLQGFATDQVFVPGFGGNIQQHFALQNRQPLAFYSLGLYFQDEYRVSSKLKVTMTMRADRNSAGICQSHCAVVPIAPFDQMAHGASIPYNQSFINGRSQIVPSVEKAVFQPRFGLAWSPFGQNTVIRAGVGLFTDLYPGVILDSYTTNFPQVQQYTISAGSIATNEAGSGTNLATACSSAFLSNYGNGGNLTTYQAAAPAACSPGGVPIVPNFADTVSKVKNPKFVEWNLEIQHTFGAKTAVSANYVGNRGYDLLLYNPFLNGFGFGGLPTAAPDSRVANVTQLTNNSYSNYNGLTLSVKQTLWHGLSGALNYSWAHTFDVASNGGVNPYSVFQSLDYQLNPFNPKAGYGPADYDLRHNLTANYVWDLPTKSSHGLLNRIVGGWTVSQTFFYHTGFPFSVQDGAFAAGISGNNLAALSTFDQSAILAAPNGSFPHSCGRSAAGVNGTPCFTAANLATPTSFINGIGRNAIRGPNFFNTDLSLRKNFRITERIGFSLGASAYNVLNHPNFNSPLASTAFGGLFGKIINNPQPPTSPYGAFASAAVDARIVQVIGKITF